MEGEREWRCVKGRRRREGYGKRGNGDVCEKEREEGGLEREGERMEGRGGKRVSNPAKRKVVKFYFAVHLVPIL